MQLRLNTTIGVLVAAGVLVTAACSSSSGSSTGSTAGANAPATSATTQAAAGLTKAEAAVQSWQQFPAEATSLPPLVRAPAPGRTFVWLQCEVDQCTGLGQAIAAAAAAVHWNYRAIPFQSSNPATLVAGLRQALQYNPAAVGLSGIPYSLWSSVVPAYAARNIPIISSYIGPGVPVTKTTPAQIAGEANSLAWGGIVADYVTAASKGKADVLAVNVPSFPNLNAVTVGLKSQLSSLCPGCTVTELDATIPQVDAGQVNSVIVSALRKNPSVNWVTIPDGAFVNGLPAALSAAGLSGRVKVVGASYTAEQVADILSGSEQAFTGIALSISAWQIFDAALRATEGMAIPQDEGVLPTSLITSANVSKLPPSDYNDFQLPADYRSEFLRLWKLG